MSIVIISNTGEDWDHDMWGVVGVIENPYHIFPFIKKRENFTNLDQPLSVMVDGEIRDVTVISHEEEGGCNKLFEKHEISFLCEGKPIGAIVLEREDHFPDIYIMMELTG